MVCDKCKSENLIVNGIFYKCNDCGNVDDSNFNMIAKRSKRENGTKEHNMDREI